MNEIDCVMAGFVGGFMSSVAIILVYCQWISNKAKQYLNAKAALRDRYALTGLEHEMIVVKRQVNSLMTEVFTKNEKKH